MDSEGKILFSEMAPADSPKQLVLQWSGHAAHVTQRFSALLARQALVDVTLICQGQKLRVHKLVLASSSLYFEEMLEQDLGQEPIILLRDLDFQVLKAMVEFMYCGETTISQCDLQTLLDAAQVFKVKQLECVVESMMRSKTMTDKNSPEPKSCWPSTEAMEIVKSNDEARPSGERCDEKRRLSSELEESAIISSSKSDRFLDNSLRTCEVDDDNSLYEIPNVLEEQQIARGNAKKESFGTRTLDSPESESSTMCTSEEDEDGEKKNESAENEEISSFSEDNTLKSSYNETRCNLLNVAELRETNTSGNGRKNRPDIQNLPDALGECSRVYAHKKPKETIDSSELEEEDSSVSENGKKNWSSSEKQEKECGKNLKVYTHKRRKSLDEKKSKKLENISDSREKNRAESQDLPHAVGECSRVYTHKKRKEMIDSSELEEEDFSVNENGRKNWSNSEKQEKECGKSLKVYTHKRRKSVDERKCEILENISDSREEPASTTSIDLNEDTSLNGTPINLSNSLDMETSEYIWSLSTENIQYVVGCTINSMNSLIGNAETNNKSCHEVIEKNSHDSRSCNPKKTRQMKEIFSCQNGHGEMAAETPVLRRSVRINQLESDDSLNNNNGATSGAKGREKSLDLGRDDYRNDVTMNFPKSSKRRCNKDLNFRITDENTVEASSPMGKSSNSRAVRSAAQISSKKSKISGSVTTTRDERPRNTRQSRDNSDKIDFSDILVNTRLNTIASVDRALWGDMSDLLENPDDSSEVLLNYSTSREIPFAVGLLPLRAALERMQATVDHQPRKTRSSVAPWRQENTALRKKINNSDSDNSILAKKQNSHSENEPMETAVCHIQIQTSSARNETRNPRISNNEQTITVGNNSKSNEQ